MTTVIPDVGRNWLSEKSTGDRSGEEAFIIAVGDGTTSPSSSDTSLASELYRANDDDSNCTVETTSNTGEIIGRITITGGTEVPAGTGISEIGLHTSGSDTLVYREVRDTAVTLQSGDRKTFEFTFTFTDS